MLCCGHNMSLLLFDQEIKSIPDFQKKAYGVVDLVLATHSESIILQLSTYTCPFSHFYLFQNE